MEFRPLRRFKQEDLTDAADYFADFDDIEKWKTIRFDASAPPEERIEAMERAFDRTCVVNSALAEVLNAYEKNAGTLAELAQYMDSGEWLKDFEADEAGQLRENIKRGVLSEDGLYNALQEHEELKKRLAALSQK